MSKRNLWKVLMLVLVLVMMISPVVGQETTPEPEGVAVVVDIPADGVVSVAQDYSHVIGMVVVAVIAIVFSLVEGYKSGQFLDGVGKALVVVRDGGLGDVIERRASQLPIKQRAYANAIIDVIDPYTDLSFTDLDDDIKAMLRDWLDGVVEPAGDGAGDAPLVEPVG